MVLLVYSGPKWWRNGFRILYYIFGIFSQLSCKGMTRLETLYVHPTNAKECNSLQWKMLSLFASLNRNEWSTRKFRALMNECKRRKWWIVLFDQIEFNFLREIRRDRHHMHDCFFALAICQNLAVRYVWLKYACLQSQ